MTLKDENAELGRMKRDARARRDASHATETKRPRTCAQCQREIPAGARSYLHPSTKRAGGELDARGKMWGTSICYDCDVHLRDALHTIADQRIEPVPTKEGPVPYWRESTAEKVRPYWLKDE